MKAEAPSVRDELQAFYIRWNGCHPEPPKARSRGAARCRRTAKELKMRGTGWNPASHSRAST